ncbi:protein-tyrosine phosphatase [Bradyrhizobium sp. USDA 4452]
MRWRQIFRSNHLAYLTEQDVAVVRSLGVKSAFDFRGVAERADALCSMSDVTVHSLPVEPTVVASLRAIASKRQLLEADAIEVMRDSYRGYVQDNTPRYRTLFAHLLEDSAPLVIHCTAGKDRTGFACALILHALGVSGQVIADDYLLTNQFYKRDPAHSTELPDDVKQVLGTVRAAFLEAAFEAIDADYGSLDGYFREGLGLGQAERRALEGRYLQA